jgi:transcriptional regulator with XRE-family HTH domain
MATLRELREQRHVTREQLATAAEVAVSTIYNACRIKHIGPWGGAWTRLLPRL